VSNITNDIKKAIAVDTLWSISDFYNVMAEIKNLGIQINHWENEEDWASISSNDFGIGYIWRRYPLILIASSHSKQIRETLINFDFIVWITFSDIGTEEFTIDMDKDLTDRLDFGLNTEKFSACDFWFHNA
jgi:hypothetical protein